MKETILETLKNLNFTEYEAKAYLALLEESPLTGYAVAKNSGVPRSRIYEILDQSRHTRRYSGQSWKHTTVYSCSCKGANKKPSDESGREF